MFPSTNFHLKIENKTKISSWNNLGFVIKSLMLKGCQILGCQRYTSPTKDFVVELEGYLENLVVHSLILHLFLLGYVDHHGEAWNGQGVLVSNVIVVDLIASTSDAVHLRVNYMQR